MYRFNFDNFEFIKKNQHLKNISISIGVNQKDKEILHKIRSTPNNWLSWKGR